MTMRQIQRRRGFRITERVLYLRHGVFVRVEDRHHVCAFLGGSVDRAVGIHVWITLVCRDRIVKITLGRGPLPHADNDNAFCGPNCPRVKAMLALACPACTRRVYASIEPAAVPHSSGSVRIPLDPSAWHDWHEFFTV